VSAPLSLRALALPDRIAEGEDIAALIAGRAGSLDGVVVVVAHTVVSKAEGAVRELAAVTPSPRAVEIAARQGRDARLLQVVLDETREVVRESDQVLICLTAHGFICANAGVDMSNTGDADRAVLLPRDPDGSARLLRARLRELTGQAPAVIVADSFGRAWRHGQVDVAIGVAGLAPLDDWRGRSDRDGRPLSATLPAIADAAAAAADLARAKDSGEPVVLIDGLARHITNDDGPGARALLRARGEDLFR
jgi:coenzyme F420-0:L-glutamate ligase/coenzyme F420-1:gamma-L-glutamate ligase